MKLIFVCVLALIAVAQGYRDWSKVKPVHLHPSLSQIGRQPPKNINHHARVTGGDEVEPHSLPYQVGLFLTTDEGVYFCGGSLISPTTVLTAAHCAELTDDIEVILGAHNIREEEDTQVRVNATEVIVHPQWISLLLLNDIAILRIPEVELNDNIGTIKLPADANSTYAGLNATVSGWGKDSDESNSISTVLRKATVEVLDNEVCTVYYLGIVGDTHICGSGEGGKSACNGDSGGPFTVEDDTIVGIVSFGLSLGCEIGWPSVFTRVTSYLEFIQENSDVVI